MQCKNHPGVAAIDHCAGCAEAFCQNCFVEIQGRRYCGACKVMALQGQPVAAAATIPCKEADDALKYAIIGIFCFGIILEPMAIVKAVKAKGLINANPNLTGSGKATAALVIAIVGLLLWVVGMIARVSQM